MRKDDPSESIRVNSLAELDALVGRYLTGETPRVHWVDSHTQFQFDSVEEAVEAVNDPFFQQFVQRDGPPTTVLMEVKEYRRYSSDLATAWELVEYLTHRLEPLSVWHEAEKWEGAFGNREFVAAPSAPLAICLAALRARGVEVECHIALADTGVPGGEIQSLYARP